MRRAPPTLTVALLLGLLLPALAPADRIPVEAERYRRTLERTANFYWGLDAPVATIAAQIHQESLWRPDARSHVGAQGLAQFMPDTADWFASMYPDALGENAPFSPGWALRAAVLYDQWLYQRVQAAGDCDRWAFVLAGYNGGLGWVYRDKRLASASGADPLAWSSVAPHNAGRSAANFQQNRHYVAVILQRWEPLYERHGWGSGVCP